MHAHHYKRKGTLFRNQEKGEPGEVGRAMAPIGDWHEGNSKGSLPAGSIPLHQISWGIPASKQDQSSQAVQTLLMGKAYKTWCQNKQMNGMETSQRNFREKNQPNRTTLVKGFIPVYISRDLNPKCGQHSTHRLTSR